MGHVQRLTRTLAVAWLALLVAGAVLADALPLADPNRMALADRNAPPGAQHLLGTDAFGRDVLSRIVHGARVSLLVGLVCPLVGLLAGGSAGMLAGYRGGIAERVALLFTDTLLALPALLVAMLLAAVLSGSLATVLTSLGLLSIPAFLRLARAQARVVSRQAFVLAARAAGAGTGWILRHHVAPNVLPSLLNLYLLVAAVVIVLEGALSYLGLGLAPPTPSWGGMIAEGRAVLETHPRVSLAPAATLVLTVLACNALGETRRPMAVAGAQRRSGVACSGGTAAGQRPGTRTDPLISPSSRP